MNTTFKKEQLPHRREALLLMVMPMATSPGIPVSVDWHESTSLNYAESSLDAYVGDRGNQILQTYGEIYDRLLSRFSEPGSGSASTASRVRFEFGAPPPPDRGVEAATTTSIADEIIDIQTALSLNVKELARSLHVQRPTIYAWLRGQPSKLRQTNRRRLNDLLKISRAWRQMSDFPLGSAVRSELDQLGRSLVDRIAETQIDEEAIREHLLACRQKQSAEEAREAPWPESMLEIAKKHGMEPEELRQSDHIIDTITGRPIYRD